MTHGLVLGFFASIMFGALQQILPVVAGVSVANPKRLSLLTFCLWVPGVLLLMLAFLQFNPLLFAASATLLSIAMAYFVSVVGRALLGSESTSHSVPGMSFALVSLIITVLLGGYLALGLGAWLPAWRPLGTNIHMSWGLLGWILILIFGIAWQVVPMFQITPAYPKWIRQLLPGGVLLLLLVRSMVSIMAWPQLALITDVLLTLLLATFALQTIFLQRRSLRKIKDAHRSFWRLSCINFLLVLLIWWLSQLAGPAWREKLQLLAVCLFLLGGVLAIVVGMLYKIVAFLVWLNLNHENKRRMTNKQPMIDVPNMRKILPEKKIKRQFVTLLVADLGLIMVFFVPSLAPVAGILWLAFFALLLLDLLRARRVYYRCIA
ncbi:MAG: hypothetical protein IMF06_01855 [Proteobacteria bacterium]|nr:hypothetical protein [Pseudomonadota bacterium]